jgi:membrane protein
MKFKQEILPLLSETWSEFIKDDADTLSGALAYYAMFSIFPLLLLLLAVLGFLLKSWNTATDVQKAIVDILGQSFTQGFSRSLNETLSTVRDNAGTATGIGLVTLLIGASGVFSQLDFSFNKIWNIAEEESPPGIWNTVWVFVRKKLFSMGMVLAVGFLLMISLALTGATQVLMQGIATVPFVGDAVVVVLGVIIAIALNTLIFALLFKYLPRTSIAWGDVLTGALVTAIIWEGAKRLLAIYIGTSSYASAYGFVGTFLVLMAWIYFSSLILFLGAEFTEVYARRCGSHCHQPMLPLLDAETGEKITRAQSAPKEEVVREEKVKGDLKAPDVQPQ